ncbi:MAG: peptide deformylase [Pseudomonadota bacterium]
MAVHPILRIGDPRLRRVAEPVTEFATDSLHTLISDMFETMHAADGAGLAAPQIGINLRLMIFGVEATPRYPDAEAVPKTVLINPGYEVLSDATAGMWEGCLSVPGMRGYVTRSSHIRYWGFDVNGERIERETNGYHSIVFLHEYDHLDGILYTDRLDDSRRFGFTEELAMSGALET